jgi:hypothetical protein
MKRKQAAPSSSPETKKPKHHSSVKELLCPLKQSKPYLLGTVKFPINELTSTWTFGCNRPLNEAHVWKLLETFTKRGVDRCGAKHRLYVSCSKAHFDMMMAHIEKGKERENEADTDTSVEVEESAKTWPFFEDWAAIVGQKAELLAGQHRVEAFKLMGCLEESESPVGDQWWVCNVYNRGT